MSKKTLDDVIRELQIAIKALDDDEEDESEELKTFAQFGFLAAIIKKYEASIAKLLREQKNSWVRALLGYGATEKPQGVFRKVVGFFINSIFPKDKFEQKMTDETKKYTTLTLNEVLKQLMVEIDEDVPFDGRLTKQTEKAINKQASQVAKMMNLNSQNTLKKTLKKTLGTGMTIDEAVEKLKYLPQFDRNRAKRVALTEVFAAVSAAQNEAYSQSPSVVGKKWIHNTSGPGARDTHIDMDGEIVDYDKEFVVDGERCQHPRDMSLSAKNRINCRCSTEPVIDTSIKDDLSKVEKEQLREAILRGKVKKK